MLESRKYSRSEFPYLTEIWLQMFDFYNLKIDNGGHERATFYLIVGVPTKRRDEYHDKYDTVVLMKEIPL